MVKKGSNTRSITPGSMPEPRSSTVTSIAFGATAEEPRNRARAPAGLARMASMPLITRLSRTCCNWMGSAITRGNRAASRVRTVTSARRRSSSMKPSTSSITALTSRAVNSGSVLASIPRTRETMALARFASRTVRSMALLARSRSGGVRSSQRRPVSR